MIVAKYKFDKSIYANLIPVFNEGYTGYTISDEIDSANSNHIIRTIECDSLPTYMRFGIEVDDTLATSRELSLIEIISLDMSNITSMNKMFYHCDSLTSINTNNWDTSKVTDMYRAFSNCLNLTTLNLSNLNTENVETMWDMFWNCKKLVSIGDISNWNTSKVKSLRGIFHFCSELVAINVSNWDTTNVENMDGVFRSCLKLTSIGDISNWDTSNVTDMSHMFESCRSITSLDVSNWNTSKVTNMNDMFKNCESLTEINVDNFDTSSVTNLNGFIFDCDNLKRISAKNISMILNNANDSRIFGGNPQLINLDISNMNIEIPVHAVAGPLEDDLNLQYIKCNNAQSINKLLNSPNFPDRTNKESGYIVIESDDLSNLNTEGLAAKNWQVVSELTLVAEYKFNSFVYSDLVPIFNNGFNGYFIEDEIYESDNLFNGEWEPGIIDINSGVDMPATAVWADSVRSDFFEITPNTIYDSNFPVHWIWYDSNKRWISSNEWTVGKVQYAKSPANAAYARVYRGSIEDLEIKTHEVTRIIKSGQGLPTLIRFGANSDNPVNTRTHSLIEVLYLNTENLTDMSDMFRHCYNLKNINCSDWDVSNVTSMYCMFCNCSALTSLDLNNWDTGNVTDMGTAFAGCGRLTSLDLSNWDTSNVTTSMSLMFQSCASLTSIDASNWDTSNVTSMGYMFRYCGKLTEVIGINNWNVSKVTNMQCMFDSCINLTSIDLSKWNTSKVTNMRNMFYYCQSLTSLDVSNWDVSNVTNMNNMFQNCFNLTELDVSRWDVRKVLYADTVFGACRKLLKLDLSNWNLASCGEIAFMISQCWELTELDLSNLNIKNVTYMDYVLQDNPKLKTLNLNNMRFVGNLNSILLASNNIEKIYMNNVDEITKMAMYFPDRVSKDTPGYLVTTLRDKLSVDVINTLAAKNWVIKDLVAQYRFNANTYEDLMPEFNPEFTEDMYEVHDSVSEIVIDNLNWTTRYDGVHDTDLIRVIPGITYLINNAVGIDWYDENKTKFSTSGWGDVSINTTMAKATVPSNGCYMQLYQNIGNYSEDTKITAKLVTRSIESKNGDLPTLMRFGNSKWSGENLTTDRTLSLLKVIDLNSNELTTCDTMFHRCERLSEVPKLNITDKCTFLGGIFAYCTNLTSLDVSNWDTSNVTSMNSMFNYCGKLTSLDVSNWDTSNVTGMQGVFKDCNNLTSLDVSNFDTSNVTNMRSMFHNCNKLTSLDVSGFDTSKVTDMLDLFINCKNLTSLDVSGFDTSKVTIMQGMFSGCIKLTSLDVSNFDTSKVTAMYSMFNSCNKLTSLDVSNFDTSKVTDMGYMFCGCNSLTSLDVSNFNTNKVDNMRSMFYKCNNLTSLDVSKWDVSKVTNMGYIFSGCNNLTSLDVSKWVTDNVTDMRSMFYKCQSLTTLDVSNFDTSNVIDMGAMFGNCTDLTSLDVSGFDTSNVTNMSIPYDGNATTTIREGMFFNCESLTSLDVSNFDTSNVIDMGGMFFKCSSLTSLDVSNWDTSKAITLTNMFDDCYNLIRIEGIENWIVDNVDNFNTTFNDCWKLRNLDLSRWNVKREAILTGTFSPNRGSAYAMNLVYLDIRNWEIDESNMYYTNITTGEPVRSPMITDKNTKLKYIRNDVVSTVDWLATNVATRTTADPGYIITEAVVSNETIEAFAAKNWNVVRLADMNTIDIAIYKFDKSIHKWLVPVFDNNFADYFIDDVVEDEANAPNIVTRTIRSMGGLPTLMRFGSNADNPEDARAFSLIEVLYLNTENLTSMNNMFKYCSYLKNINCSDWNISKVTGMWAAFLNCGSLTSIDVNNWNVHNVTDMSTVFAGCGSLTSLDVSNWDTSNVTTMALMFQSCVALTSLDVSNWDTGKVLSIQYMFRYCYKLTEVIGINNWDVSKVIEMAHTFSDCRLLTSLDISNWDTSKVTNMSWMFNNCRSLTSLDVSNFNTSKVTTMYQMFKECYNLTSLDVSNFDTSNVTEMGYMFAYCNNLTSLDVSNFNTSKVTSMHSMFENCNKLTSLDVSNFNTSNVTIMLSMFNNCKNLTSLDLSNFDTSKVTNMSYMFNRCENLTSLDLSNFDTSKVTTMEAMFAHTYAIKTLDLSSFTTENLRYVHWMFTDCYKLTDLDISNWNSANLSGTFFDSSLAKEPANIGMIYSNNKAIKKIASFIRNWNTATIWVGNHIDINGLPQYDHITYKVYEVEDKLEVELSSPLLEGDRLEIIDGDLYHYHKMKTCILDEVTGLETFSGIDRYMKHYSGITRDSKTYSSVLPTLNNYHNEGHDMEFINYNMNLAIRCSTNLIWLYTKEGSYNIDTVNQFLTDNPIPLIYELANPYYELVKPNVGLLNAEQGLYLNISDSVVPVVNHHDLCTLKLNYLLPNVQYKVKFKANNPGSIAINLGGTLVPLDVVEGWNEVMVTTPETLVDEYLKVNGSEGIKIQNVMVIDSDKDFDYFKGINNTFDEIPVKNICTNRTLTYTHGVDEEGVSPQGEMNVNVSKGKVVTVVGRVSNNPNNLPISINLYNDTGRATGKNLIRPLDKNNPDSICEHSGGISTPMLYSEEEQGFYSRTHRGISFSDIEPETHYTISVDMKNRPEGDDSWEFLIDLGRGNSNRNNIDPNSDEWVRKSICTNYCYEYVNKRILMYVYNSIYINNLQIEKGTKATAYEPFRTYVNDEPIFIDYTTAVVDEGEVDVSTTDGYFAITIRADRDYANRIGFNVGDASSCEANDQVTITDLMVFEGDILDCQPTTYVDPADTRYLVEYKSIGNPFGFGKNKLI